MRRVIEQPVISALMIKKELLGVEESPDDVFESGAIDLLGRWFGLDRLRLSVLPQEKLPGGRELFRSRWSGEGVAVEFRDAIVVTKILVLEEHRGAGLVGG